MTAPAARRESILEKTRAGQLLAQAKGKHIGRPKGLDADNFAKVKNALERGLSVRETVSLTGISMSSVKRYRKQFEKGATNSYPSSDGFSGPPLRGVACAVRLCITTP